MFLKKVSRNAKSTLENVQELLENLKDSLIHVFYKKPRNFCRRVYNVVRWLPILWKDSDWDYEFILDILVFKLKNVRKDVKNWKYISQEDKTVEEITEALGYYEAFINEDPHKEADRRIEKIYGKSYLKDEGKFKRLVYPKLEGKSSAQLDKALERMKKIRSKAIDEEQRLLETFFKLLGKNIRKWWY